MTKMLLAIHDSGGSAALLSVLVPLANRQGGTAHRCAGWVFAIAVVVSAIGPATAAAQTLATGRADEAFEVTSVKPTTRMQIPAPVVLPGGQFEMSGITLRDLIRVAYPTTQGQVDVVGGPDWVRTSRFDVVAKTAGGAPPTTSMLQALLVERFKLKLHLDKREGAIWSLTVANTHGKLGPTLTAATCGAPQAAPPTPCTPLRIGAGPTLFGQASIADLASILSNYPVVNAPVVDRTGLPGAYDIRLQWRPDTNSNPEAGPLLFTALEEHLGLKLERSAGTVDIVVIDDVQPLTEN